MTVRTDIDINYEESPKVATVVSPSVELSVQDMHDTLARAEDSMLGHKFENLILSAGKEDLGGSVLVGITSELQNIQVTFEDRSDIWDTASITTPDANGILLTDSAATFETALVTRGDLVVNVTDGSHATVLEVLSETQLDTQPLAGGIDNQYDTSDVINIFNIYRCTLSGGNTVAIDDVGAELDPVLQSFGTQIKVSASSSATLQEQGDIQHASFDGGVHVDVTSSQTGSAYPSGNSANPVNNWADAKIVNTREGFDHYFVDRSTSLDSAVDFTDAAFTGKSIIDTVLAVPVGTTVDKAEFTNLSLEGSLGETTIMQHCFLGETNPLLDVRGVVEDCSIGPSPLTLGGTSASTVRFVRCNGAGEDTSPATVNGGGDGPKFDVQDYTGALKVANKTGAAFWDIHVTGELIIDSTCIAGVIRATGAGNLTDESGAGCVVIDEMLKPTQVIEMWKWQGLEFGNPMTVTTTERSVADQSISVALTGDGTTTTTVTRQTDQTILFDAALTADLIDVSDTAATATFTRASAGTYKDPVTGFITSAAIDVPRFELAGVLIEEERENICLQSEDFSTTWALSAAVINTDATTAPDNTSTADRLIDNNNASSGAVIASQSISGIATTSSYVYSKFLKADQNTWGALAVINFTTPVNSWAYFDLNAGIIGSKDAGIDAHGIEDYGNGWYRCWIAITTDAADTIGTISTYVADGDGDITVTRNNDQSIFMWGGQFELGTSPSAYIPTTTIPVTRSADFLSYNNDVAIDLEGSMIASINLNGTSVRDAVVVNMVDQLAGPLYLLDSTTQEAATTDGTTVNSVGLTITEGVGAKIAARWSIADNELQVIADGVAATVSVYDESFARTPNALYIGSDSTGNHINGNIKSVKIYSVDRGTAQLQVDTG